MFKNLEKPFLRFGFIGNFGKGGENTILITEGYNVNVNT